MSPPSGRVVVTERSDFSKYENGTYLGHVYREARLDLGVSLSTTGSLAYDGEALVFEETLRDERAAARRLDAAIPVSFTVSARGDTLYSKDEGYPILRHVPLLPDEAVPVGGKWTGEGVVVVRPRPDEAPTRIPVLVEYEYRGRTRQGGREVHSIRAQYAVRYKGGDRLGDPRMSAAQGGRIADITIAADDGSTLFIRETVDETFTYTDRSTVRLKGFILHFHRGSLGGDRDRIASLLAPPGSELAGAVGGPDAGASEGAGSESALGPGSVPVQAGIPSSATQPSSSQAASPPPATAQQAQTTPPQGTSAIHDPSGTAYELARSERGVVLLLYDLRFVADGDQILSSERGRIDTIAAALKKIPERSFLVEGHTADLGKAAGQYELSERRARRVVDELVARGIPAGRFVYRGLGADAPIAPSDTEANRARNRRVEITILD
jgi:outer membrane protein OmpA-like peptidoglycan-associated protein